MAVIISNGDTTLATANGFYRVEAYNVGLLGGSLFTNTDFTISVTFANAGNCQGLGLAIYKPSTDSGTMTVTLQEKTGTSPDVWTDRASKALTSAELAGSNSVGNYTMFSIVPFQFASPYAVDTTAGKWRFRVQSASFSIIYFHTSSGTSTANTFYFSWCDNQVSFTNGDVVISKDVVTIDQDATWTGVLGTSDTTCSTAAIGCRIADHTANKYSFVWENPAVASYTLTVSGYIILSSDSGFNAGTSANPITNAEKAIILFDQTPAAGSAGRSGFWSASQYNASVPSYYGCRTNFKFYGEKPTVPDTTLAYNVAIDTTVTMTIASPCVVTFSAHDLADGDPIYFSTTGALPTGITAGTIYYVKYINANSFNITATRGGANIDTSGVQSGVHTCKGVVETTDTTGWAIGDTIYIGKRNYWGTINDFTIRTIADISGKQIKQSSTISTYTARAGGIVARRDGYGVEIKTEAYSTADIRWYVGIPEEWIFSGVLFSQVRPDSNSSVNSTLYALPALRAQYLLDTCFAILTTAGSQYFMTYWMTPPEGTLITDCNFIGSTIYAWNAITPVTGYPYISGTCTLLNNNFLFTPNECFFTYLTGGTTYNIHDNAFENFNGMQISGLNSSFYDNVAWGTSSNGYKLSNLIAPVNVSGNSIDKATYGVVIAGGIYDAVVGGFTYGANMYSSSNDLYINLSASCDLTITACTNLVRITQVSRYAYPYDSKIVLEGWASTNDSLEYHTNATIQKCGTGLTDTTVHTAGGYSMRIEPIQYLTLVPYSFKQIVPTGNIQNKAMAVSCWVKIGNANYYSGTHRNPRLKVTYDNGVSTVTSTATDSTSWQLLSVAFTPTTTTGQITVEVDAYTDQTSSNAQFYLDDFSIMYPAGTTVNLGSLDNWYRGIPTIPTIATLMSAADIWEVQTSGLTTTGSVGKLQVDTEKKVDDNQALIIAR